MGNRGFCCLLTLLFLLLAAISFSQETELKKADEYYWIDKDSSAHYFDLAFKNAIKEADSLLAFKLLCEKTALYSFHRDIENEKNSLYLADSFYLKISDTINKLPEANTLKYYYWYNKGSYYYNLQNYTDSRDFFFKLLNDIEKISYKSKDTDYSEFEKAANSFIATTYRYELKFDIAEEFYQRNLRLHRKYNHDDEAIYDTKNLIASLKAAKEEYSVSNKYAKESIAWMLNSNNEGLNNGIVSTSILLANNYLKTNQPDSAQYVVNRIKLKFPKAHNFTIQLLLMEAGIAKQKKEYRRALGHYQKALQLAMEKRIGDEVARIYQDIGELHYDAGAYEKAVTAFQKGAAYFELGPTKLIENRKGPAASNRIASFPILLGLSQAYGLKKNDTAFKKQLAIGNTAITELLDLKTTFYDDADKQTLVENVLPIFENSIEASYQCYQHEKQPAYIDTAFTFFERSKGSVLLDALHKNRASSYAGVPSELLEQEKILKVSIADATRAVKEGDSLASEQLFALRREHEELLSLLEKEHPKYFELKYDKTIASLKEVQGKLGKRQTAISYFFGEGAVYIIRISKKDKALHKVPISKEAIEQIKLFKQDLGNPQSNLQALNNNAFNIYKKFVAPALSGIETEALLIMPDGILQAIPFGALNTNLENTKYLVKEYSISYSNSATLWLRLDTPKKTKPSYFALAPSFKENRSIEDITFAPLPTSSREVDVLAAYFKGNVVQDNAATLSAFKNGLENHNILHLATHARTNDKFPEYSFLAFSPDGNKQSLLYINDLYALDIPADLVTLSACETGLGELQKGEGAISLARAFFYSGASSLVQTSWSINDGSTPEIMDVFYSELAEGKTKHDALQYAQLSFLEKHKENRYSHPYYWSGFLLSGNTEPLVDSFGLEWFHYMIIVLLGTLLTFLILRRKN